MTSSELLADLQAENARLIALLEAHNIEWRLPPKLPPIIDPIEPELSSLSTAAKKAKPPANLANRQVARMNGGPVFATSLVSNAPIVAFGN